MSKTRSGKPDGVAVSGGPEGFGVKAGSEACPEKGVGNHPQHRQARQHIRASLSDQVQRESSVLTTYWSGLLHHRDDSAERPRTMRSRIAFSR